uniref:Uncharacterized protein n=1 Tax=Euplotes crassus TaxID=5936 RepID=A0A7S3K8G5_EUPCR|mmetsp:Transcript_11952/g.11950  ORF Transcript_11952/g.11950 Transcript_11952/m.11950 type:complete len:139 (+) Transcript_11952:129-545(+)
MKQPSKSPKFATNANRKRRFYLSSARQTISTKFMGTIKSSRKRSVCKSFMQSHQPMTSTKFLEVPTKRIRKRMKSRKISKKNAKSIAVRAKKKGKSSTIVKKFEGTLKITQRRCSEESPKILMTFGENFEGKVEPHTK